MSYIGICGCAKRSDKFYIFRILDNLKYKFNDFRIIYESESAVGKIAGEWGRRTGISGISERVLWFRYGPSARAFRSEHILNKYSPFLVVGFFERKKYPDLLIRAKRSNIQTMEFYLERQK